MSTSPGGGVEERSATLEPSRTSIYGDLPAPLAAARRIGLVRYADLEDVRAGRACEAAARVAQRTRRLRVFAWAAFVVSLALIALELAFAYRLANPFVLCGTLWGGTAFPALNGMMRDLEALASGGSA